MSKSTCEQMRYGRCLSGSCCPLLRSVIVYPAARSMGAVEVLADRSGVRFRSAAPPIRGVAIPDAQNRAAAGSDSIGYSRPGSCDRTSGAPSSHEMDDRKSCKRLPSRES